MNAEKKSRLGRGLDALLGGDDVAVATAAPNNRADVAVTDIEINPFQPRKQFDDDQLKSLQESIKHHGILQPLVVRQVGERFQLIAGERRLRAAQLVGLSAVPVTVVDFNDQQTLEAALVENIQRADLNPIEKAHGFKEYIDRYHMTHDQLATRLGLGRTTITNLVSMLELPVEVQEMLRQGTISAGHAKAMKGLNDPARQIALARDIVTLGLSVHATESLLKAPPEARPEEQAEAKPGETPAPRKTVEKTTHVQGVEDELKQKLALKVEIKVKGKDRGQILLSFETNDDFERVLDVLRR